MKMSEVTGAQVINYLRLFEDELTLEDHREIDAYIEAAKDIVRGTTGLSDEQCDEKPALAIAVLILVEDMYDNRTRYVKTSEAASSKTLESILALYDHNLV